MIRSFRQPRLHPIDKLTQTPAADHWGERMPRSLGPWGATAVVVGITIGSGIFRVPATVAAQLHAVGPAMVCWLLGGLISLCGALSAAELGAALGATSTIFAEYLGYFLPISAAGVHYVAALMIVLMGAINYIGLRRAAAVMNITT